MLAEQFCDCPHCEGWDKAETDEPFDTYSNKTGVWEELCYCEPCMQKYTWFCIECDTGVPIGETCPRCGNRLWFKESAEDKWIVYVEGRREGEIERIPHPLYVDHDPTDPEDFVYEVCMRWNMSDNFNTFEECQWFLRGHYKALAEFEEEEGEK